MGGHSYMGGLTCRSLFFVGLTGLGLAEEFRVLPVLLGGLRRRVGLSLSLSVQYIFILCIYSIFDLVGHSLPAALSQYPVAGSNTPSPTLTLPSTPFTMPPQRKKLDPRIPALIANGVQTNHRSFFVLVGDRGRDSVVTLHFLLSKARVSARPSVLWCYKKELGFSR